jgi:hypothetical protein
LKAVLGLTVVAGVSATFFVGPATADPYKWCAIYGGRGGGATNCGFVTLQQCQATISGIGGTCEENPRYTGGERLRAPKRHRD